MASAGADPPVPLPDPPPNQGGATTSIAPATGPAQAAAPLQTTTTATSTSAVPVPSPALLPGATVFSPTATPSDDVLNPRSCVTCRRRKVRCDKHQPCHNCRRAGISCVFPAPGRAPRRPRPRDPNTVPAAVPGGNKHHSSDREVELMRRLRKLEGIVEELSGQIEMESTRHNSSSAGSPEAANFTPPGAPEASVGGNSAAGGGSFPTPAQAWRSLPQPASPRSANAAASMETRVGGTNATTKAKKTTDVTRKFGRLVLHDDGNARYISSGFWSRINDELTELRAETQEMLDTASEASEGDDNTPEAPAEAPDSARHSGFLFGLRSSDLDLRPYHPEPAQIPLMWQLYQENVQPLYHILHGPTMRRTVEEVRNSLDNLDPAKQALMFAIYLGAVTSLEEDEVKMHFGEDKSFLLSKYRFSLEQALAQANFLVSSELTTLQALVLYAVLVRRRNETRFVWTIAGLVVRISQALGLHRDPSNFPKMTPFEAEMRRRLFWVVALVDFRAGEDQGSDMAIADRTWDTRMPLNINDADFGPESTELPEAREGPTEMTFCLMIYEIQPVSRRLHSLTSAAATWPPPFCPRAEAVPEQTSTLEDRERMLGRISARIAKISPPPGADANASALSWTAATVGRLVLAKLTIIVYQSVLFAGPGASEELSPEARERLFAAAVEVFEVGHLLQSDPRCKRFRWMFSSYAQWQTSAYLLMELSRPNQPWSPMSERAWAALNTSFDNVLPADIDRMADNAAVWVPFRRLYAGARRYRAREVARLKADPAAALELDRAYYPESVPTRTFGNLSGSIRGAVWREKWRKLVEAPPLAPGPASLQQQRSLPGFPNPTLTTRLPLAATPISTPTTAGGAGQPLSSPTVPLASGLNDFMSQVMTNPLFVPSDFWPMVVTHLDPANLESAGNGSENGADLGSTTQKCGGGARGAAGSQLEADPRRTTATETPFVDSMRGNYTPLWTWPDQGFGKPQYDSIPGQQSAAPAAVSAATTTSPTSTATTATPSTTAMAAAPTASSSGDIGGLGNDAMAQSVLGGGFTPLMDDWDVNMDLDAADINWQNFGETMRDFQAHAGFVSGGSIWGP